MGRLDDLKAAMNSSGMRMGRDINAVRESVYGQVAATPMARQAGPAQETLPGEGGAQVNTLLDFYISIAGSFCRLNGTVLVNNILVVLQGLPEDIRDVSLESAVFAARHMGDLLAAMVLDYHGIRGVLADAVSKELDLVKLSAADRAAAHGKLGGYVFDQRTHGIEMGVSAYGADVANQLAEAVVAGMDAITGTKLMDAVDARLGGGYAQKDADEVGMVLSNPVYLMVLLNHNAGFVKQVSGIFAEMHAEYKSITPRLKPGGLL